MNFDSDYQAEVDSWPDYLKAKSQRQHRKAWNYFVSTGEIPASSNESWCLHHIDPTLVYFDPSRYTSWNIEDLRPMTVSQHMKLH